MLTHEVLELESLVQRIKSDVPLQPMLKGPDGSPCRDSFRTTGFVCPHCGSGTHDKGTGAVKYYADSNTAYCFACEQKVDQIDLWTAEHGGSFIDAVKALGAEINCSLAPLAESIPKRRRTAAEDFGDLQTGAADQRPKAAPGPETAEPAGAGGPFSLSALPIDRPDYTEYYRACQKRLKEPEGQPARDYLQSRGISMATARYFGIGYDPTADTAKNPGALTEAGKRFPVPRIIHPLTDWYYMGRRIDGGEDVKKLYPHRFEGMPYVPLFNAKALETTLSPVFIVEGVYDAMSIAEVRGVAVALNGVTMRNALIDYLKAHPPKVPLLLSVDNDKGTNQNVANAERKLIDALKELGVKFAVVNAAGDYKDANEFLTADRAGFREHIRALEATADARPDSTLLYLKSEFRKDSERFRAVEIKTGFPELDAELGGGLHTGLTILAGGSSVGKTSFVCQIADQIAAGGADVLFFSLEQSTLELVSKSLSRITAENAGEWGFPLSELQVRKQGTDSNQVRQAIQVYQRKVKNHVSIIEGENILTLSKVREETAAFIERTGKRPVVILDYLQILQPETPGQAIRETVDQNVTGLRRLARLNGIPVIALCSLNRSNYLLPFDFESLKESGGIEYGADTVMGLQLSIVDTFITQHSNGGKLKPECRTLYKNAKAESPRKLNLICLKNRGGNPSFEIPFDYDAAHGRFTVGKPETLDDLTEPESESEPDGGTLPPWKHRDGKAPLPF